MDPLRWAELAISGRRHLADVYVYVGSVLSWFTGVAALTGQRPANVVADFVRGWGAHEVAMTIERAASTWSWFDAPAVRLIIAALAFAAIGRALFDSIHLGRSQRLEWGPDATFFAGQYQYLTRMPATCWILGTLLLQTSPMDPPDRESAAWGLGAFGVLALTGVLARSLRHRVLARVVSAPLEAAAGFTVAMGMTAAKPLIDVGGWVAATPWSESYSRVDAVPSGASPR